MGNAYANTDQSLCGLNLFSAKDLHQTSLQTDSCKRLTKSRTNVEPPHISLNSLNDDLLVVKGRCSEEPKPRNTRKLKRSHTFHPTLKEIPKEKPAVTENDFRILKKLAKGRYGKVCIVKKDDSNDIFAMKVLCKKRFWSQPNLNTPTIEKEILEKANHPFIPKLVYSFENESNIFLVSEYIEGGELHEILKQHTRFSEERTRFYSAEALLALEYLHQEIGVIYKDLKSENILLDSEGHVKLIDFDQAQKLDIQTHKVDIPKSPNNRIRSDSPRSKLTREGMTEVMTDYWGFGCFVYELLTGNKPFQNFGVGMKKNIIDTNGLEWPQFVSKNARDLIRRLFNPKVEERLGYNGIQEIKKHAFFSNINWEKLGQKSIYPPFNPSQCKELEIEKEEIESDNGDNNRCSLDFLPDNDETKGESLFFNRNISKCKLFESNTSVEITTSLARSIL